MISLLLVLALVVGVCPAAFAADSSQNHTSEIQPREILTLSSTQYVYLGQQYVAEITLLYTARNETVNGSGLYITGILSGSAKNVRGWAAVGAVTIDQAHIVYSSNHQKASVPITYQASIGTGYNNYTDTIYINLF